MGRLLDALGRPGVAFGASTTGKFRCLLAAHEDTRPSAVLYRSRNGAWRFRCHGCAVGLSLPRLVAAVASGAADATDTMPDPTAAQWRRRAWHLAGVERVEVPGLPEDLAGRLTDAERRYAGGFLLLRALRRHDGDFDFVPYTHGFAAAWCGLSEKTAQRAAHKLVGCGFLRLKEQPPGMRCGFLYDIGPVLPETGDPSADVVAWTVFGDDGLPVGELPALPLREGVIRPLVGDEGGQEGDPVLAEMRFPAAPRGVEVHPGGPAADEVDDFLDVEQVHIAERVAGLGALDAPRGPAGGMSGAIHRESVKAGPVAPEGGEPRADRLTVGTERAMTDRLLAATESAPGGGQNPSQCPDPSCCSYRGRHASGPWGCEHNHPRAA